MVDGPLAEAPANNLLFRLRPPESGAAQDDGVCIAKLRSDVQEPLDRGSVHGVVNNNSVADRRLRGHSYERHTESQESQGAAPAGAATFHGWLPAPVESENTQSEAEESPSAAMLGHMKGGVAAIKDEHDDSIFAK